MGSPSCIPEASFFVAFTFFLHLLVRFSGSFLNDDDRAIFDKHPLGSFFIFSRTVLKCGLERGIVPTKERV